MQCATFTGIRPVFAKNLIILEWYGMWYVKVVCPIILVTEPLAALHKGAAVLSCAAQRVRGPETPAATAKLRRESPFSWLLVPLGNSVKHIGCCGAPGLCLVQKVVVGRSVAFEILHRKDMRLPDGRPGAGEQCASEVTDLR